MEHNRTSVDSLQRALEVAVADPRLTAQVTFQIGAPDDRGRQAVTFRVEPPGRFRIWKRVGNPASVGSLDLYIVPAYHPDCDPKKQAKALINSADGELINQAVSNIFAPPESTHGELASGESMYGLFDNSWNKVTHPFYAAGQEIRVKVVLTKMLTEAGIEELVTLLVAVLELENTYLHVSGGFSSLFTDPMNVRQFDIEASFWTGIPRGTEPHCVWAYQVLKEEGS